MIVRLSCMILGLRRGPPWGRMRQLRPARKQPTVPRAARIRALSAEVLDRSVDGQSIGSNELDDLSWPYSPVAAELLQSLWTSIGVVVGGSSTRVVPCLKFQDESPSVPFALLACRQIAGRGSFRCPVFPKILAHFRHTQARVAGGGTPIPRYPPNTPPVHPPAPPCTPFRGPSSG